MRSKLEYLLEGNGEYPPNDSDHPLVSQPSMKIVGEEALNICEQIDLCNKLVDRLKDGGNKK